LYSGEQFDSKIGQQYLRQRYYDPATGRFNRLDPFFGNLTDPQSLHKYLYTHADPINGIDSNGELAIFPIIACTLAFAGGYAIGGAIGAFVGHYFYNGSSLYTSTWNAVGAAWYPVEAIVTGAFSSVIFGLSFLNAFWDWRALYNKTYFEGNGGKNADTALKKLRTKIINDWKSLSDEEKTDVLYRLHSPVTILTEWDISQLVQNKHEWTDGIDNPAPETLTYDGHVYATAEVHYLLWGMIHKLAYEDNIMVYQSTYSSMLTKVFVYRGVVGAAMNFNQWRSGTLNYFESTGGKALWADYGWRWVEYPNTPKPTGVAIKKAIPSNIPWDDILEYNAGTLHGSTQ
jgi:RHS repeat-associated protein